ncbi:D-sedoheptulose 7-phosphate isomerase [Selenomonadales bacterium OttesenSCG-928-I06]|nr:D-sedoheptulose 7-phosphate isomerase [Selenomonadales bacterium OttesenSCG-928-I06]
MSILENLAEHQKVINDLIAEEIENIEILSKYCVDILLRGNTIFLCGNGGSAADSQHIAAEIVGRFQTERRALKAIAFTTDTSILTAVGNDYGYDNIFKRQVEALVAKGDLVIGLSTSGNSKNVVLALEKASELGAVTASLTGGDGGKLKEISNICIVVPTHITARVQEAHILIGHAICAEIDKAEAENNDKK